MAVRKIETSSPVTMGHIRGHGCHELLVYCGSGQCHHSARLGDWLADDVLVRSLCRRKATFTKKAPPIRAGLLSKIVPGE